MADRILTNLVVPLDGSEAAERALPVAAALATMSGASTTLVRVVVHEDHVPDAEESLRRAARNLGQPAGTEVLVGVPGASTLRRYLHADRGQVVVMSTHARRAVAELLLGSVADEMVRHSPVPVVLVGPHTEQPAPGDTYEEVIVCLDGSRESQRLLPLVTLLHQQLGLHPWLFEVRTESSVRGAPAGDVLETTDLQQAAAILRGAGVEADWDVGHDEDRASAIVTFAGSRLAPIIAVATRGRDATARLAASSLTVAVARAAPCPVLVVGPAFAEADAG